jgi:hypothetical protein
MLLTARHATIRCWFVVTQVQDSSGSSGIPRFELIVIGGLTGTVEACRAPAGNGNFNPEMARAGRAFFDSDPM